MTPAQIRAVKKALNKRIVYTPALIRKIRKRMAQGRPGVGRIVR
jgi:hypothetical protein